MPILLDLSRLRGGVEVFDRRDDPSAFDLADAPFRLVEPVHLVAEVRKDASKARLVGRLTTAIECECSRCLESYAVPVAVDLDLVFLPAPETSVEGETEIGDDDLGASTYRDDAIDLGDVTREQLFLALPMKPLCRDDCGGLCPVCGTNRNRDECACRPTWTDPRLAVLEALKTPGAAPTAARDPRDRTRT